MFKIGDIVRLVTGEAHMRVEGVGTRDSITYYICRYINSYSSVPRKEEPANRLVLVEAAPTPPKAREPVTKWYKPAGAPQSNAEQVTVLHVSALFAMVQHPRYHAPLVVPVSELSDNNPADMRVVCRFWPHGRDNHIYWTTRGKVKVGDRVVQKSGDVLEVVEIVQDGNKVTPSMRLTGHLVGPSELT